MDAPVTAVDALANAVRDFLCETVVVDGKPLEKHSECEYTPDGKPNPDAGERFVAVHGFSLSSSSKQCLDERYSFKVTVTLRSGGPYDRKRDAHAWAMALPIRAALHMSDLCIIKANQYETDGGAQPWVEPMMFASASEPIEKGPDWFWADATGDGGDPTGIAIEMTFRDARRVQYIGQEED